MRPYSEGGSFGARHANGMTMTMAPRMTTHDMRSTLSESANSVMMMSRSTMMTVIHAAVIHTPVPANHAPIQARAISQLRQRLASTTARTSITRMGQHKIAIDPMIATMPMRNSNDAWQVLQLGGDYLVRAGMVMRVDRMFSPDASLVWKYTLTFRPVIRVHRNDSSTTTRVDPLT